MSDQANVVTIDGTEYKSNDFTKEQMRLLSKVSKWKNEINILKDSLEDAKDLYNSNFVKLKTSLANSETMNGIKNSKED